MADTDPRDHWLQYRLTLQEAVEHIAKVGGAAADREIADFRTWYAERFQPGDELWWYDMGVWEESFGEAGFAIVRGEVTAYMCPRLSS